MRVRDTAAAKKEKGNQGGAWGKKLWREKTGGKEMKVRGRSKVKKTHKAIKSIFIVQVSINDSFIQYTPELPLSKKT